MKNCFKIIIGLLILLAIGSFKRVKTDKGEECCPSVLDTDSTDIRYLSNEEIESKYKHWFKGPYSQVFFNFPEEDSPDSIVLIIPTSKHSEILKIKQDTCEKHYIYDILMDCMNRDANFKYFETIKIPINKEFNLDSLNVRFCMQNNHIDSIKGKQILKKTKNLYHPPSIFEPVTITKSYFSIGNLPQGFNSIINDNFEVYLVDDVRHAKSTKKFRFLIPCTSQTRIGQISGRFQKDSQGIENLVIDIHTKNLNEQSELNRLAYLELKMGNNNFQYMDENTSNFVIRLFKENNKDDDNDPEEVKVIDADIKGLPLIKKICCK